MSILNKAGSVPWLSHRVTAQLRSGHREARSHSGSISEEAGSQEVHPYGEPPGYNSLGRGRGTRRRSTTFMEAVTKGQKGLVGHPILPAIIGHQQWNSFIVTLEKEMC